MLISAGCGSGGGHRTAQPTDASASIPPASGFSANTLALEEDFATANGESSLTVTVFAESFFDLYQIAGTLCYDTESLELTNVSQGSFLGDPPEVVFFHRSDRKGDVPFALTRRDVSPGAIGRGILLRAHFRVLTNRLPERLVWLEHELLARDSQRHRIEVNLPGGEE